MAGKVFVILMTAFFGMANPTFAQKTIAPSKVKWYTFTEAIEMSKKEPRPIILDIYTNWCTWCDYLMKTTFGDEKIANYINDNFYAARLDAETTDTIEYNERKYFNRQIGRRPVHDLAAKFLNGNLSYPSVVFFDSKGRREVISGYKEPKDYEPILVYFAEEINQTIALEDFVINFMFTFSDPFVKDHSLFNIENSKRPDTLGVINWVDTKKAYQLSKRKKKPILMYLYDDNSYSCKIMEQTSFGDRKLADYINTNYISVKINSYEKKQLDFLGQLYKSTGENNPNQIVYQFLDDLKMPAIVLFDENYSVLTKINGYLEKQQLFPLAEYYCNKSYKKLSLQEYLKTYMTGK